MSSADQLAVLEVSERNDLESLLMQFDQDWTAQSLNDYRTRLQSSDRDVFRKLALTELVKIDLQRLWAGGEGQRVEDYLAQMPELGTVESVDPELILAELSARKAVDPNVSLESYASRFPRQYDRVVQLASQIIDSQATSQAAGDVDPGAAQASIDTSRVDNLRDTASETKRSTKQLPTEFGRYRIVRELGAGAMGTVYLAHDSQLDRQVAIKTPSFSGAGNEDVIARFYREARAAAKIQHRNICPVHDVGKIDDRHFISMAFVKGREMSDYIKPDALPPQRTSALLIHRLAIALAEAHRHNVIHRDLKPANIMIDTKREPVVMDFGLARQTDVESRMTDDGTAVGTPAYMSPEQVRGENDDVGPAADIYALGVILYELLTGTLPFRGSIAQVVYKIVSEEPVAPSKLTPGVEPELESICAKMMAKRVDQRYPSMDAVAADVKAYLKGKKKDAGTEPSASQPHNDSSSKSNLAQVTETGALNAFFAAQAFEAPAHTVVEPPTVAKPRSLVQTRTKASSGGGGRRLKWIVSGFGGFFLLAGVIIYFTDGSRVEIPAGTEAKVETNADGTLKSITTMPASDDTRSENGNEGAVGRGLQSDREISAPNFSENGADATAMDSPKTVFTSPVDEATGYDKRNNYAVVFSPNLEIVDTAHPAGTMRIRNVETGEDVKSPTDRQGIEAVAWSADRSQMVLGLLGGTIEVWQDGQPEPMHSFRMSDSPSIRRVLFSPDNRRVIACGDLRAGARRVVESWSLADGSSLGKIEIESNFRRTPTRVVGIDVSADGSIAAIASGHGVQLWSLETNQRLRTIVTENISDFRAKVNTVVFSSDGKYLGVGGYANLNIVEVSTGKILHTLITPRDKINAIAFAPDGQSVVSGSWFVNPTVGDGVENNQVRTRFVEWDLATGKRIREWQSPGIATPRHLVFSADGRYLATAGNKVPLRVWDLEKETDVAVEAAGNGMVNSGTSLKLAQTFDLSSSGNQLHALAITRDGRWLAHSINEDRKLELLDLMTNKVVPFDFESPENIYRAAFSEDGRQLLVGTASRRLSIFDVIGDAPPIVLRVAQRFVEQLAFAGDYVVAWSVGTKGVDPTIERWRRSDWKHAGTITPARFGRAWLRQIAIARDGEMVAVPEGNSIRVWSFATGRPVSETFGDHDGRAAIDVRFSPDGNRLLSFANDGLGRLWDTATGKRLLLPLSTSTQMELSRADFSPDGRWIVTVRSGKNVDVERGRLILRDARTAAIVDQVEVPTVLNEGEGRHAFVKLLAISGDGRTIITAGQATPICVWRVEEMGAAAAQAVSPVSAVAPSSPTLIARRVAERVKLRGGLTDIRFVGRDGGTRIHPNMPIPSEPFHVTRIEIRKRDSMNTDDLQLFADLKNLPELTSLNLGGMKLMANGLSAVAALPQLETLDLNRSTIRDTDLKSLVELRSLTTLDLISTGVTNEGLKTLGTMSQLSNLYLKDTGVTDEGIAHLVGLHQMRWLILTNTRLTDASVQHLKQFSKLRWLYINGTDISAEGIAELQTTLPKCEIYTVPPPDSDKEADFN